MERHTAGRMQNWIRRVKNARLKGPLFLLLGLSAGVVLGLFIFWGGPDLSGGSRRFPPSVGSKAEDFRLHQLDGSIIRLEDLRGRPVLINFWATWCQPCRAEMPVFERAAQAYADRLVIVGINYAEDQQTVDHYVQEIGIHFPVVLDIDGEVSQLYFVRSYPSSFFVDSDGMIRALHLGALTEEQLYAYLETIGIKQ